MVQHHLVDLFSGLGGWHSAFTDWRITTVDNDPYFGPTICEDVLRLNPGDIDAPDVVLASPPCGAFSLQRVSRNWRHDYTPRSWGAEHSTAIVRKTVELIEAWQPRYFIIENPVGMLRKLDLIPYERRTISQCLYGKGSMKPTDLWGQFPPGFVTRYCGYGSWCHPPTARGSQGGIVPMQRDERARIPELLSLAVYRAVSRRV